jgi:hypothetical protein
MSQVEVTQAQDATAHVAVDRVVETSAQEVAMAWDSTVTLIRDGEDQAALAEREVWERVLKVEMESVTMLASAHREAEGLVWMIALLKGELTEAHRAWELAEENSLGLSDAAVDAKQWQEESERESQEQFEELTLL